jgi:sporadic carbohydrate cluster protein (TIGR04323 family)
MVRTLKGYVTVRSFNRMAIPVPVQNMILRNYSQTMGMSYALPYGEHKYEDCYMQLFATMKAIPKSGDLGICSIFMLPINYPDLYQEFKDIVFYKKIKIHSIFEKVVIEKVVDFENVEETIKLRNIADLVDSQCLQIKSMIRPYKDDPSLIKS